MCVDNEQWAQREADKVRLTVIEAQLHAFENWATFTELILQSEDRGAAMRRLQEPPFAFSEIVASYLLDIPVGRSTEGGRRSLADEVIELRQRLSSE